LLICHCSLVTDREIRDSIRAGADSLDAVAAACGAGACCGGCEPMVERLIQLERGCPRLRESTRDSSRDSEPAPLSAA